MDLVPYSFYLSAWEEDRHTIAQANIELDEKQNIVQNIVDARRQGNFILVNKAEVDYVDVSPKQLVSVAASLVPFLEHDDANRALMGSNMQKQATPCIIPEAPLVATGIEEEYSTWDHIDRLRFLSVNSSDKEPKEIQLMRDLFETKVPGMEEFISEERYLMLEGKLLYNAYGIHTERNIKEVFIIIIIIF